MKKEFLSKSGLVIYDEELKQYLEERFGNDISEALSDVNNGDPVYVWIGTKEEYETIEEKLENCLYITTDDSESVEFENTQNKVTEINENANNITYPTTLAVKKYMANIDGYEKTENKDVVISNASDDNHYPSSKAVYENVNNTVNSIKNEILTTLENRVYGVEKTTNKVTEITENAKHTSYPSAKAVWDLISQYMDKEEDVKIETVTEITENSTDEEIPSAKAVHDFVVNHTPELPDTIPTVHTSSEEPADEDGKVGDLWCVI